MNKIWLATILVSFSGSVLADTAGFRVSGGVFDYEVSGTVRDSSNPNDALNLKSELGLRDDSESSGFVYLEHPLPLIPNIRVGTTNLKLAGSGTISTPKTFNGTTFAGSVTSLVDLSHSEIGLYYELIDTGIDFDLGLNFKFFDGRATVSGGGLTATQDIDVIVPMVYGALNIPILNTGLHFGAEMSVISFDDNELTDVLVRLRYQTDYHFGIEAGVRALKLKIEDTSDQLFGDMEVKGPYINLFLYF